MALSVIERTVLDHGVAFLLKFFDRLGPKEICQLSKTNRCLMGITRFYILMRWDVLGFLSRFFVEEDEALALFNAENAILFGPAVIKFFDRVKDTHFALDLCVNVETLDRILPFLESEGFRYISSQSKGATVRADIDGEIARTPVGKLRSSGERNMSERDRSAWGPYDFVRDLRHIFRRVRLHVVRRSYEFHWMGLRDIAVSEQQFVSSTLLRVSTGIDWFEVYAASMGIHVVKFGYKIYDGVEIGDRYIGDGLCWIIPDKYRDPEAMIRISSGPYFEVLDWLSGTTRADSYLRIGEPGVWSQWRDLRLELL
ncbi:hypothetical protein CVT26_013805 [Gymnopilus dilepis]|uniref:Uncharacterized protein n=1 Tax=Gymnopilus dilepis TaxID=231916 RepID=A0A409WSQ0_9AGAR|nr:hypothetical protein CVT26_013805 [Gymnopilus dilepis]